MFKPVEKAVKGFDHAINYLAVLAGATIILTMTGTTVDVFMRYVVKRPILWMTEVNELCLAALGFLAAAWVLKREGHVKIDMLTMRLNPRHADLVDAVTSLVGTVTFLVVAWYGAGVTWDFLVRNVHSQSIIALPMFPRFAIVSLGSLFFALQFFRRGMAYLGHWRNPRPLSREREFKE